VGEDCLFGRFTKAQNPEASNMVIISASHADGSMDTRLPKAQPAFQHLGGDFSANSLR
jgi:hypothetical protein